MSDNDKWYWVEQLEKEKGLPLYSDGTVWMGNRLFNGGSFSGFKIRTRKGWVKVNWNDWIVKVANGDFRVYSPSEFKAEYYIYEE